MYIYTYRKAVDSGNKLLVPHQACRRVLRRVLKSVWYSAIQQICWIFFMIKNSSSRVLPRVRKVCSHLSFLHKFHGRDIF